jgi:cyclopropane fatty-acyl-phospholipid synthase-like methyltransferase
MMGDAEYVHGYTEREARRLQDQASTLAEILHQDTRYPAGSTVLEAGCGVGAQTIFLATNSPSARITSVDLSAGSLEQAAALLSGAGLDNVVFRQADVCSSKEAASTTSSSASSSSTSRTPSRRSRA